MIVERMILNFQKRARAARGKLAFEARFFNSVDGKLAEEECALGVFEKGELDLQIAGGMRIGHWNCKGCMVLREVWVGAIAW